MFGPVAGVVFSALAVTLLVGCGAISAGPTGTPEAGAAVRGYTTGAGERAEATVGAAPDTGTDATPVSSAVASATPDSASGGGSGVPGPDFVTAARKSGGLGRRANSILAVRFGEHPGYDRVVVDLGTGDEPARKTPEWTLESPVEDGVLRLTFPSVGETGVSNGALGGSLLRSFYVVRAPDEGMFVDVFVREGFSYRVFDLPNPARLVVDFKPSERKLRNPLPARNGNTVLLAPRRGAGLHSPFTVSGYSRNPEAANSVTLTDAAGDVMARKLVQSNDWTTTWGYFETTLAPSDIEDRGALRVGAPSARDGAFDGVEIPVRQSRN